MRAVYQALQGVSGRHLISHKELAMERTRFDPIYDRKSIEETLRRASAERRAAAGEAIVHLVQGAQDLVMRLLARVAFPRSRAASDATGKEFSRVA
jgi:hypothetical protein